MKEDADKVMAGFRAIRDGLDIVLGDVDAAAKDQSEAPAAEAAPEEADASGTTIKTSVVETPAAESDGNPTSIVMKIKMTTLTGSDGKTAGVPTAELDGVVETAGSQAAFVTYAKTKWELPRDLARVVYKESLDRIAAAADTTEEVPAEDPCPDNVSGCISFGTRPPLVVEDIEAALDETEAIDRAAEAREAAPTGQAMLPLQDLQEDAANVLANVGATAAVSFLAESAGIHMHAANIWVTRIVAGTTDAEVPPILKQAQEEYLTRLRAQVSATLDDQVQTLRTEQTAAVMDPAKGVADGQHKIDLAGDSKSALVQAARRVARTLGEKGPITIDEVTMAMSSQYNVLPVKDGKTSHNWKGSVFTKKEWVVVGEEKSKMATAHGRPVFQWALKTWLAKNTLNGRQSHISSFVVSRLYNDFKHLFPQADLSACNCILGEEQLAEDIKATVICSGNKLYEIPVTWMPGSVGAVIKVPATLAPIDPPQSISPASVV